MATAKASDLGVKFANYAVAHIMISCGEGHISGLLLAPRSLKVGAWRFLANWGVPVAMIALVGASEIFPDGGLLRLLERLC